VARPEYTSRWPRSRAGIAGGGTATTITAVLLDPRDTIGTQRMLGGSTQRRSALPLLRSTNQPGAYIEGIEPGLQAVS
jgi:hypothetical protein